jgi:hypothetical protein
MRFPRALVFIVTLTAALAAHANAPPDQYLTFPPNAPMIVDRQTGLTWQRTPTAAAVPPTMASAVCGSVPLGGKWRLPTVKELLTIVDETPHKEHDDGGAELDRYIDPNAFFATPAAKFIGASPDSAHVWFVDFASGQAGYDTPGTQTYYVRCVKE